MSQARAHRSARILLLQPPWELEHEEVERRGWERHGAFSCGFSWQESLPQLFTKKQSC